MMPEVWEHRRRNGDFRSQQMRDGTTVAIAIGRIGRRLACGCRWESGIRLDNGEDIFGAVTCFGHRSIAEVVMHAFQTMEKSDDPAGDVWERLFEQELVARAN